MRWPRFRGPKFKAAATAASQLAHPLCGRPRGVYSTDRCRNNVLRRGPLGGARCAWTRTEVQHFEVSAEEAGQRLDNYVHKRLSGVPRSRVYRVIRKGEVRVNGRRAGPETRLEPHDRIRIPPVRVMPLTDPGQPPPQLCATLAKAIIYE